MFLIKKKKNMSTNFSVYTFWEGQATSRSPKCPPMHTGITDVLWRDNKRVSYKSDIEIAQEANMLKICEVAEKLNLAEDDIRRSKAQNRIWSAGSLSWIGSQSRRYRSTRCCAVIDVFTNKGRSTGTRSETTNFILWQLLNDDLTTPISIARRG